MRPLNYKEVQLLQIEIKTLTKGQLQWGKLLPKGLQLGFWMSPGLVVLEFRLMPKSLPFLWLVDGSQSKGVKSEKKPLAAFIEKHFKNLTLIDVIYDSAHGRSLSLVFDDQREISFELVPHSPNIKVKARGKSVFWAKPIERPASNFVLDESVKVRSFEELQREFASREDQPGEKKRSLPSKKDKATIIEEIKKGIQQRESIPWGKFGEWLQNNREGEELPKEFQTLWKKELTWAQNLDNSFVQKKKNFEKIQASQARIRELEISLKSSKEKTPKVKAPVFSGKKQTQFFTIPLEHGLSLYIGKSAKENLSLLRKARSWDLWFHIKDQPGSHGIVFLNKGQDLPQKLIPLICQSLLEKTFKSKAQKVSGVKFEVICAEVRHVQPIKGDKLGRVTVRNEKTFLHLFT